MKIQYQEIGYITVFESVLYRTTSTILELPNCVLIVDPNWSPQEVRTIQEHVATIQAGRPLVLLFTHSDYDHILAYRLFEDAVVIASEAFAQHPNKAKAVQDIRDFDAIQGFVRDYELVYPEVDYAMTARAQRLELYGMEFQFYPAPGHTFDGLFMVVDGVWLAGDYLSNIEFPFIYDSVAAYLKTLTVAEQLIALEQPRLLIPGHGDCTSDTRIMQERVEESRRYIESIMEHCKTGKAYSTSLLEKRYWDFEELRSEHEANLKLLQVELSL